MRAKGPPNPTTKVMKRRLYFAPLTALAVSVSLVAPIAPLGAADKAISQNLQYTADTPHPAKVVRLNAVGDTASLRSTYGFAAHLPKDVEGFAANYHVRDLVQGFASSKWFDTFSNLPPIKEDRGFQQMMKGLHSPDAVQALALLDSILGQEFVVAMPAGFSDKTKALVDAYVEFIGVYAQNVIMSAMSGKKMGPKEMDTMMRNAAPDLIPAFAKAEIPPFLLIAKAGGSKAMIDQAFAQLTEQVGKAFAPAEIGSFKAGDADFKSISVTAKKLIAAFQEEQFKVQLKELLGDEAKAKAVLADVMTKKAEIAWGWVGEYFIISIGSDHSHVKFAASDADSVLSVPEVAAQAAAFAGKKPIGLNYISKTVFDKFSTKIEFAETFDGITDELKGILKEDAIKGMRADVRRLETQAQKIFNPSYDAEVDVSWWDAGLHGETFGGYHNTGIDSSKPLALASLASPTTFFFAASRSSANSKLVVDFLEDGAATVWSWYQKYGTTMVPESERQGAQMIEAVGLPLVKQAWGSLRALGKALGDEGAFLIDVNGDMPSIPDVPPFLASGKIPRIAFVADLKDRASLSESWKGFASIIKQVAALAEAPQQIPEPQVKTEGGVEFHYIPLPVNTGDLLPHIAISKDRWIVSTSPSYSKELAAKAPGAGQPMGGILNINFTALWDLADKWLAVADKNSDAMFGQRDAGKFKQIRPVIDSALKLARSLEGVEAKMFEEGGKNRLSLFLKIEDVK